jgi:hypothetical protein
MTVVLNVMDGEEEFENVKCEFEKITGCLLLRQN